MENRRIVLAQRPTGLVDATTTRVDVSPVPSIGDGEALLRVGTVSIDPTIRTWMDDAPGYLPPIGIGEVIRAGGAGVVIESKSPQYAVGDVVYGMTGWQQYCVVGPTNPGTVLPKGVGVDLGTMLNATGLTGVTAYFGVLEVGQLKSGDVVVVSGAAGATGSVAGQVAKAKGAAKVIGIAGGAEKCAEVVEQYGFDACLDYKEPDLARRLHEQAPKGVDLYFDNVGGEILDTVMAQIAMRGRIVLCGAISQYNGATGWSGLKNHAMLIVRRGRMEGFIVLDYFDRINEAIGELTMMLLNGQLAHREHYVHGLEKAPDALNLLFTGGNHGKTLVVVDETVTVN